MSFVIIGVSLPVLVVFILISSIPPDLIGPAFIAFLIPIGIAIVSCYILLICFCLQWCCEECGDKKKKKRGY